MFGSSTPFGQSSTSPFGSQSVFGQSNNASSNAFAPKPFGTASPFGSQTGGSIFGGTSTGVFGASPSSSPFGASSTPAFGASSTPAFGTGSSSFGGSSMFGQKPAFGSTPSQTSPFGNTNQQTQSTFGSNIFGATSSPAFGMTGTSAFGAASTPAFGSTNTPAFGSSTSAFGSTGSAFGQSSAPAFGSGGAFGTTTTPAFGAQSTSAFGASTSGFGASSSPSFNFGSSPFGQSNSGSSPFGTTPSPFGAQSSSFGSQATTSAFGSPAFGQPGSGGQRGGSRVTSYSPTVEVDGSSSTQAAGKLDSISAMPAYKDKSHEELRWADYELGDKGGPSSAAQPAAQPNPFGTSSTFGQSSSSPFSSNTSTFGTSSPFGGSTSSPFGSTTTTSAFGVTTPAPSLFNSSSTANPFGTPTSSTPSLFGATSSTPFGATSSPSLFSASSSSLFGNSPSPAPGNSNFGNTQSAPLFQSTTPSFGQPGSVFGQQTGSAFGQQTGSAFGQQTGSAFGQQTGSAFGQQTGSAFGQQTGSAFGQQTGSAFGQQTGSAFGQQTGSLFGQQIGSGFGQSASSFSQSNMFGTPSTGFGIMSSSTPSLFNTNNQPAQTSGAFNLNNLGQTQASNGFGGIPGGLGQGTFGLTQSAGVMQPAAISNPFGTLPAMPQMSIGRSGSSPSVQYGISSMPINDKPNPVRVSSLLTSRHLSQRRTSLPSRKYHPKNDSPKVPFFSDEEEAPSTPKADALFVPRENPRTLVIQPSEKWPSRTSLEKPSPLKNTVHSNGGLVQNGLDKGHIHHDQSNKGLNRIQEDDTKEKAVSSITADIEALMPKLKNNDYYTEPRIQELAAKERAEPGFCQHVKDFVVGREGYGSIKFAGETDVRRLDLESLVQFNNREVIVYMDDSKKPPVGQGLNKPAEVSLLNIKCFNRKTEQQYTEGPKVEKYKEMLKKKAEDQGAEFVSYDPLKGEWRFKVKHFSRYSLEVEDEVDL